MVRFLARTAILLLANAIGLVVATLLLPDFRVDVFGFTVSVLVFTGLMILLEPFVLKMAIKYMPALRGGIALVTIFVSLLVTSIVTSGLNISSVTAWLLAPLVVWCVVVVAGIVLPMFLFKQVLEGKRNRDDSK